MILRRLIGRGLLAAALAALGGGCVYDPQDRHPGATALYVGDCEDWAAYRRGERCAAASRVRDGSYVTQSAPPAPRPAGPVLTAVKFDYDRPETAVDIQFTGRPKVEVFTIAEACCRLVVDFSRASFDLPGQTISGGQRQAGGKGVVARYRYAQYNAQRSRLVFDLEKPAVVTVKRDQKSQGGSVTLTLRPTTVEQFRIQSRTAIVPFSAVGPSQPPPTRVARAGTVRPSADARVIVIDAGHGGRDPGAIAATGVKEKDVNLAVAKRLAARLGRSRDYDVVLTRTGDTFLDLNERLELARDARADLFLSLHADSLPGQPNVGGASVYTLSERGSQRARREVLTGDQNWIRDVDLTGRPADVSDILLVLAQRDTNNRSAVFAETLIPRLDEAGRLLRNSHRSAGFYVLLAPDVPAVLVEMGFLSNEADARRLATAHHQERMAQALEAAITDYFALEKRSLAAR